jgi:hypothetical protein
MTTGKYTKVPELPGHKSSYFTTGRPKSHWRKCSCGWISSGMSSAEWARKKFAEHLAEVHKAEEV